MPYAPKMNRGAPRCIARVLGVRIDPITWDDALQQLSMWAWENDSRYVCVCNVHSVVTAGQDMEFDHVIEEADMVTPDGAPVAWMLNRFGYPGQQRINGPDLMWRYCEQAAVTGESIYLYGGMPETLDILQRRLVQTFPGLRIAGAHSPPFRELMEEEDRGSCSKDKRLRSADGMGEPRLPEAGKMDGCASRSYPSCNDWCRCRVRLSRRHT